MDEDNIIANHTQGYADGVGNPFGWAYRIDKHGTVEFNWHVQTEIDEQLVNKRISLLLTFAQLAALSHDVLAARQQAMERQTINRSEA